MGTVYLAVHPVLGRKAAAKVLRRVHVQDDSMVARFMNEAHAANAIAHPNIIDVIDVGSLEDGVPYLMMEHLEGETLAQRLARLGRASLPSVLAIVEQAAAALAAAHGAGIVHRDLKPENLFLARDPADGRERVKILDFGIAKLRPHVAGDQVQSDGGRLMGTPAYMAPEQCRGLTSEGDPRTDVYALGILIYEMLCGQVPFRSDAYGDMLVMQILQPPTPPRRLNPDIPEAVEQVVLRALAKDPADRFPGMPELWAALSRAAGVVAVEPVAIALRTPNPLPPAPDVTPAPAPPAAPSAVFSMVEPAPWRDVTELVSRKPRRRWLPLVALSTLALIGLAGSWGWHRLSWLSGAGITAATLVSPPAGPVPDMVLPVPLPAVPAVPPVPSSEPAQAAADESDARVRPSRVARRLRRARMVATQVGQVATQVGQVAPRRLNPRRLLAAPVVPRMEKW